MLPEGGLRFDGYLARPRRHTVEGPDGEIVPIGLKAMAVLVCLAQRSRRVVPKDDLLEAAWKDENVGEGSLFNAISELRAALERTTGSRPYDPEMIETIRGEGYSLNADVEWLDPTDSPADAIKPASAAGESAPPEEPPPSARPRRPRIAVGIAGLGLVVIAGAVWLYSTEGNGDGTGWQTCRDESRRSFQEAEALYKSMQYDLAIDLLGRTIDADLSCAFPFELRARIFNNRGEKALAQRDIEQALKLSAELGEITRTFFLRRKAQIEENVADELRHLKRLNSLEPLNPEWHYHLGWFYKAHYRDCDKSQRRFQDAIHRDPRPSYYALLSEALLVCGQVDEAIRHLDEYVTRQPGITAHDFRGWVYTMTGRYDRAERELLQARTLDPDYHHAVLSLGTYYAHRGRYSRALEAFHDYRSRVELPNEEAVAHASLAEVYLAQRRFDDALEYAGRALAIKPSSHQALGARGQALLSKGELLAAEEVARTLEDLGKSSGSLYGMEYLHHLRGRIAWAEGRLDEAVGEIGAALDLNPVDRAFFGDELASALFASGDLKGAEEAYLTVLEFNPSYGRTRCGLGELYERQGFADDAVEEYERCLRAFGEDNQEEPLAARARERLTVLR